MTLVHGKWCEDEEPTIAVVVPGRVLCVRIVSRATHTIWNFVNVHSVGALRSHLTELRDLVRRAAAAEELVVIGGDFNFGEANEDGVVVDDTGAVATYAHVPERRRWDRALGEMMAAHHGQPTRAAVALRIRPRRHRALVVGQSVCQLPARKHAAS